MSEGTLFASLGQPSERQVRAVDAPLSDPAANLGILSVLQRPYLLRLLVWREVKQRYAGSFMGLMWSYSNPFIQFMIYWLVMGEIMGANHRIPGYTMHVFSGFIIAHFFMETFAAGTHSIVSNKVIVQKLAIPRELFPVAAMLVSLYQVTPAIVIMVIFDFAIGWHPTMATFAGFGLALLIVMLLGTACALVFAVANVYFRDFGNIVGICNHFVRFGVPMVYAYSEMVQNFGSRIIEILSFNPLFEAVLLMQRGFWVRGVTSSPKTKYCPATNDAHQAQQCLLQVDFPPHFWVFSLISVGIAAALLVICQLWFTRLDTRIPERI
jgi:ABC-2 type transport system permease protein